MKKRTVITRNNYKPSKGKKIEGKSMTIEGDTTDIKTILQRHALGQQLMEKAGVYIDDADHNDEDGQQFRNLDLTEQEDVLEGMRAMSARLKALEREYEEAIKTRQIEKNEPPKQPKNEGVTEK